VSSQRIAAVAVVWLLLVAGGGALLARHDASVDWHPGLSLAGVDAVYALRRVAAVADVPLTIDEDWPSDMLGDLGFRRVDLDVKPGPLEEQLEQIRGAAGGFEWENRGGAIYVRSTLGSGVSTALDQPVLPATELSANLRQLTSSINQAIPGAYLELNEVRNVDWKRTADLEIAEGSSAVDLLVGWSARSGVSWLLQRAGQETDLPADAREGGIAVIASVLTPLPRLDEPQNLPTTRHRRSPIRAIAQINRRTGTPMLVFDQSRWGNNRGGLDMDLMKDPRKPVAESLNLLGFGAHGAPRFFTWDWDGEVAVIEGRHFLSTPNRERLLDARVGGGLFEGSLAALARHLNRRRLDRVDLVLMGGEEEPGSPRARFRIPDGATVREALFQFTRETGVGIYYVVLPYAHTLAQRDLPEHSWVGAYVSTLDQWAKLPKGARPAKPPPRASGLKVGQKAEGDQKPRRKRRSKGR
jgi:hypothetical protein